MKISGFVLGAIGLICCDSKNVVTHNFNKLVWADEFNYSGLPDSTKWGYDAHRLENARVDGDKLIIEARKENYNTSEYTSARLTSKNKGDWKYCRVEARVKIPAGTGIWPAFWMLPTENVYGGWPSSGEIDIMENVGYWPDSVLSTIHTGAYNGMKNTQKTKGVNLKDLSTAFHVYGMEWTEETISFYIDDIPYHVFKNEHTGTEAWPYDRKFHLLMNIAVGGNWGGKFGVDEKIFPQRMEVDYVRVYQ